MWIIRNIATKEVVAQSRTPFNLDDPLSTTGWVSQWGDGLEVLQVVDVAPPSGYDRRYQKPERVDTEPGDGTIQRGWQLVSRSKDELKQMAEAEFEKRVDAVAGPAERDRGIITMIKLLEKRDRTGSLTTAEQTKATNLMNRVNWLDAMADRLAELKAQIDADQPFDFDTGWPSLS